jgi:hypothetical protein
MVQFQSSLLQIFHRENRNSGLKCKFKTSRHQLYACLQKHDLPKVGACGASGALTSLMSVRGNFLANFSIRGISSSGCFQMDFVGDWLNEVSGVS